MVKSLKKKSSAYRIPLLPPTLSPGQSGTLTPISTHIPAVPGCGLLGHTLRNNINRMIFNACYLQSKYLTFLKSRLYTLPLSGLYTLPLSDLPKVTLQAKALPPPGPVVFPCSITSPALQAVFSPGQAGGPSCLERPLHPGVGVQAESRMEKGSGRQELSLRGGVNLDTSPQPPRVCAGCSLAWKPAAMETDHQ